MTFPCRCRCIWTIAPTGSGSPRVWKRAGTRCCSTAPRWMWPRTPARRLRSSPTQFIEETGVYCFAPAIGTAHGLYKAAPQLRPERVTELVEHRRVRHRQPSAGRRGGPEGTARRLAPAQDGQGQGDRPGGAAAGASRHSPHRRRRARCRLDARGGLDLGRRIGPSGAATRRRRRECGEVRRLRRRRRPCQEARTRRSTSWRWSGCSSVPRRRS